MKHIPIVVSFPKRLRGFYDTHIDDFGVDAGGNLR